MEKKTFYLTCERTWVYDTLIFAAGILGSYTYMLCGGIFCNAQTGNIVLSCHYAFLLSSIVTPSSAGRTFSNRSIYCSAFSSSSL